MSALHAAALTSGLKGAAVQPSCAYPSRNDRCSGRVAGTLKDDRTSSGRLCTSSAMAVTKEAMTSMRQDGEHVDPLSRYLSRRQGLLLTAVVPLVNCLDGFGILHSASAAEEEQVQLQRICTEVIKSVSKGKAAGILRLVFHDAGTFNLESKQGGMNGSILYELERPESAGLKRSIRVLEKVRDALEPELAVSWADLIAVAGAEAVAMCGGPRISLRLGRLDSSTPDPEGEMPEETLGGAELKKKFQLKGFSTQELVALSGAHTIGNKGFGLPDVFDNTYYKILMQRPWAKKSGDMNLMVGLASDRNLVDDDECLKWVKAYAVNQDHFFHDFSNAYLKLVNTGAKWAS